MKLTGFTIERAARIALSAVFVLAGCRSATPYDYLENWLIRDDSARPFAIPIDIIYMPGELYTDISRLPAMTTYARSEVGRGRFDGVARVFSPLVTTYEDMGKAIQWYFEHHHSKNRPFVFIGEGEGGAFLRKYEDDNGEELDEKGLVASFYTHEGGKGGFVNDEMIGKIMNAVLRHRYRNTWGREMPEGMLDKEPGAK